MSHLKKSRHSIFVDWAVNPGNMKGRLIMISYRLVRLLWLSGPFLKIIGLPFFVIYRVCVEWLLGVELGWSVEVGPRLRLYHGVGLVIHPKTIIGADCMLRHATTLGNKGSGSAAPVICDGVDIGCGSIILGGVTLGEGCKVGAGSLVIHDVAADVTVVGNPAVVLSRHKS